MAEAFGTSPQPFTGGERLDDAGYADLARAFTAAGIGWPSGDETRDTLNALRATYEPLLAALSAFLLAPLPGWLPHADVDDHWSSGHCGTLARELIEDLSLNKRGG